MICGALRHGMSAKVKGVGEGAVILLDTVPLVRHILCPHIRSVSEHLLTRSEKSDLSHTINVMVDLGLTYTQVQLSEGKFRYSLEPDLDLIATFPDVAHEALNYWTCQLVCREVQEEYIRRATPKQTERPQQSKDRPADIASGSKRIPVAGDVQGMQITDIVAVRTSASNVLQPSQDSNANVKEVVSLVELQREICNIVLVELVI